MLAVMNTCPTSPVEVHLMVEDCENRLTDEQVGGSPRQDVQHYVSS
jgi:hypothetical protein